MYRVMWWIWLVGLLVDRSIDCVFVFFIDALVGVLIELSMYACVELLMDCVMC